MSDLTRTTVNLTPNAIAALNTAAELVGHSRTDVINRAIQIYAAIVQAVHNGNTAIRFDDDGVERVLIQASKENS
jgi:hypothetical protein